MMRQTYAPLIVRMNTELLGAGPSSESALKKRDFCLSKKLDFSSPDNSMTESAPQICEHFCST